MGRTGNGEINYFLLAEILNDNTLIAEVRDFIDLVTYDFFTMMYFSNSIIIIKYNLFLTLFSRDKASIEFSS